MDIPTDVIVNATDRVVGWNFVHLTEPVPNVVVEATNSFSGSQESVLNTIAF